MIRTATMEAHQISIRLMNTCVDRDALHKQRTFTLNQHGKLMKPIRATTRHRTVERLRARVELHVLDGNNGRRRARFLRLIPAELHLLRKASVTRAENKRTGTDAKRAYSCALC